MGEGHRVLSQTRIELELINMLYQQAHTALIGVMATATGLAAVFYTSVSHSVLFTWLAVIYALVAVRYFFIRKFKTIDPVDIDAHRWGTQFAIFTFLSGLTWGAASIILFLPDNLPLFNILTLTILAMTVGSLAALSALPKAYYLFVIPTILPMVWRYLTMDDEQYVFFGILLFVFVFALFSIVRVNNRIIYNSIVLRFENMGLIDQLTEQKEKAEQANIAKTKFLAAASHDLRQPLHAMGLFLGALESRVEKDDQKIIVQKIQKSSVALNGLLDSLLDISKLDAQAIHVEYCTFPINTLFDALENEFQACVEEKGLSIKFVRTQLWIKSDYRLLDRMIRNLISNAVRYTNTGGIVVGCRRQGDSVMLAIYDTGIGIHQHDIDNIFREFHQLANPERDRSKGLGLGLAIVERMAKLLNMSLYLKSVPDRGSVFGVVVPIAQKPVLATGLADEELYSADYGERTILVVDDEEDIRDSLSELLRNWQCQVVGAASAQEAVSLLAQKNILPDIILTDYRLRGSETGMDVINAVKLLYPDSVIPAIVITGDTAPERIRDAESSGYKIIHKPVLANVLRECIDEALTKST